MKLFSIIRPCCSVTFEPPKCQNDEKDLIYRLVSLEAIYIVRTHGGRGQTKAYAPYILNFLPYDSAYEGRVGSQERFFFVRTMLMAP